MTPKLVIFDCDGVLVDTEVVTNDVISANLGRHGLVISPTETHRLFAGGTMRGAGQEAQARGATLPDNWLDDIYAEVFARLRMGVEVIAGVMDLIEQLERHSIPMAIASNGPIEKMEITLRPSGLWDRFAARIYSGHDHTPKPAPDMLLQIIADMGVSTAQTVMIDDMAAGCKAAQAAEIRCFGYVADGDPARINGTDAIPVASMAAIAQALNLR